MARSILEVRFMIFLDRRQDELKNVHGTKNREKNLLKKTLLEIEMD